MDWLDLLAVQGTIKSILQHHSSNASILQCSAFFTVQVSHLYMTIESLIRYLTTQTDYQNDYLMSFYQETRLTIWSLLGLLPFLCSTPFTALIQVIPEAGLSLLPHCLPHWGPPSLLSWLQLLSLTHCCCLIDPVRIR